MNKCFKCGGAEIVKGSISRSKEEFFSDIVFSPVGIRFLTLAVKRGTKLEPESYACLSCGSVWSQTDIVALKAFVTKNCKVDSTTKR